MARAVEGSSFSAQVFLRCRNHHTERYSAEVSFGKRMTRHEDLELMIRRAQTAIFSQFKPASTLENMSAERLRPYRLGHLDGGRRVDLSESVICVDISAPELVELRIIELSGERSQREHSSSGPIIVLTLLRFCASPGWR